MRYPTAILLSLALGLIPPTLAQPAAITTESVVAELTDLSKLAEWPDPPFICRQFSSYDRASTTPDDAASWFANGDAGNFLRTEQRDGRAEYVLMDAAGPGAIVRIWSANPAGRLRFYFDDAAEPALTIPMRDLLGGFVPGIPPPIAGERSRGWNCYFPFVYANRCVLTCDAKDFYYHVGYRTYAAGTLAKTFESADLERVAPMSYAAAGTLAFPRPRLPVDGETTRARILKLPGPGQHHLAYHGSAAITGLTVKLKAADQTAALRATILRLTFDEAETVAVPLGDFFGAAPGINPFAGLPAGVNSDGRMWCNWVMPFRKSAAVEFEYQGSDPIEFEVTTTTSPRPWTERSLYFHAHWRSARDVPVRPMIDWNFIEVTGAGVLVGAAFSIANPVKAWWGEGDEKIYIDGESFPSYFGTGTEDYFGYAWCSPVPFTHAYHAQPRCDGPGNYGFTALNRWHILDRIPFERSLRFDMELWHWNPEARVTLAATTYAYARGAATVPIELRRPRDLVVSELPPYRTPRVADALEGEELTIGAVAGRAQPQEIDGCSNEQHLWWREAQPDDMLRLTFLARRAGRYRVCLRRIQAPDYGIHRIQVNGEPVTDAVDSYAPAIQPTEELDLGCFDLRPGENELVITVVGTNPAAIQSYMFGLDYLLLLPEE